MERGTESIEHVARPRDRSRVEQRQQKFRIVFFELCEVTQLADLVTHHDAEIPQRMEEATQKSFLIRTDGVPEQDQQVDVRMEAQMPPAVPAKREDRDRSLWRHRVAIQLPQDRVDPIRISLEGPTTSSPPHDIRAELGPGSIERGPHRPGLSRRVGAARG